MKDPAQHTRELRKPRFKKRKPTPQNQLSSLWELAEQMFAPQAIFAELIPRDC